MVVNTLRITTMTKSTRKIVPMIPKMRPAFASPSPPRVPPLARILLRELLPMKYATGPRIDRQHVRLNSPSTSDRVAALSVGRLGAA